MLTEFAQHALDYGCMPSFIPEEHNPIVVEDGQTFLKFDRLIIKYENGFDVAFYSWKDRDVLVVNIQLGNDVTTAKKMYQLNVKEGRLLL